MSKVGTFLSLIKKDKRKIPAAITANIASTPISHIIPDKMHLSVRYKAVFGRRLNWQKPEAFTEKLQWLKLFDRKPIYTQLADKYLVRDYIKEKIGEEYLIPLLGVWDKPDDIDFKSLPEQFVLKCTHDSGSVIICKDKETFDCSAAIKRLNARLQRNLFWLNREWVYKDIKPRVIAEKYMEDTKTGELRDYKFFCFDGVPKMLFVATGRQSKESATAFDFFDMEYNWLDIRNGHPNASVHPEKPVTFEQMKVLASKLSKGFPEARIDFYEIDGKIYFGEITFFHNGGFVPFDPDSWDYEIGKWLKLPD